MYLQYVLFFWPALLELKYRYFTLASLIVDTLNSLWNIILFKIKYGEIREDYYGQHGMAHIVHCCGALLHSLLICYAAELQGITAAWMIMNLGMLHHLMVIDQFICDNDSILGQSVDSGRTQKKKNNVGCASFSQLFNHTKVWTFKTFFW